MSANKDCSPVSAPVCWAAYIVAVVVGIYTHIVLDEHPLTREYDALLRGLGANVAATVAIYCFSFVFNNSSIYDAYWVIPPPLLATKWVVDGARNAAVEISQGNKDFCGGLDLYSMCAAALVWLWAIRYHVGYPWSGWKTGITEQDWRYVDMLQQLRDAKVGFLWWVVSFTSFHLTPTLLVHLALAPLHRVMTDISLRGGCSPAFQVLSLFLTAACILWQWLADEQMRVFRESIKAAGPKDVVKKCGWKLTMRDGLWGYSRHPNYFGEVAFWISIYIMYLARYRFNVVMAVYQQRHDLWLVSGCLVMFAFFRFASVKLMDDRSLKGDRKEEYAILMEEVSPLVPWPAKLKNKSVVDTQKKKQ